MSYIECPNCKQKYEFDESCLGQNVECQKCSSTFTAVTPISVAFEKEQIISCPMCLEQILPGARKCKHCGEYFEKPKSKTVYIVLALFLGFYGVHNFYAGERQRGKWHLVFVIAPIICIIVSLIMVAIMISVVDRDSTFIPLLAFAPLFNLIIIAMCVCTNFLGVIIDIISFQSSN